MMRSLSIDIPDQWTDAEALAVFEFVDSIRDHIWDHYCLQIQTEAKATRCVNISMVAPEEDGENDEFVDDPIPF
jgi:hypothetical protein